MAEAPNLRSPGGGFLVVGDDLTAENVLVWHVTTAGAISLIDTGADALNASAAQTANGVVVAGDQVVIVGTDVGGVGVWRSRTLLGLLTR